MEGCARFLILSHEREGPGAEDGIGALADDAFEAQATNRGLRQVSLIQAHPVTPRAARLATSNDLDIVTVTDEEAIRKLPGRRITLSERA